MHLVYLIIIFALTITFSNIFNRVVPIIPLPIIQIIMGVFIGLTSLGQQIIFEPEMFLILIIAPLLFREGEQLDTSSTMKYFDIILFLAFAGVIITLLGVGWVLHLIMPKLPLAACFALGAALGPTDAVAVGSLSSKINIPSKVMHILDGEGLINDASGVTAFQFALAALITGSFSPAEASVSLLTSSIGGALVGIILLLLKKQVVSILEKAAAKDVTGYLLLELLLPFLAYVLAEIFGFSGIIAAVSAGVMQAATFKKITLFEAELFNLSEGTWSTITFILNALVFLFLGIELAQVFSPIWNDQIYSNAFLMLVVLILSCSLIITRFLSILIVYIMKHKFKNLREYTNEILLLTFGGVKGTVSLATIFILPLTLNGAYFADRSLLLFITACVILVTLFIGMIILPVLTESDNEIDSDTVDITILQNVIKRLEKNNQVDSHVEIYAVIENYQERIKELYVEQLPTELRQEVQELRTLIVSIERDGLEESFKKKEITLDGYRFYKRLISRMERSITKQLLSIVSFLLLFIRQILDLFIHPKLFFEKGNQQQKRAFQSDELVRIRQVISKNTELVLKSLENLKGVYDEEILQFFIEERLRTVKKLTEGTFFDSFIIRSQSTYIKELLSAYQIERQMIDQYEEDGKISLSEANDFRKKINLLESFSMNEEYSNMSMNRIAKHTMTHHHIKKQEVEK